MTHPISRRAPRLDKEHARRTVQERVARGQKARGRASRASHARWEVTTDRPDPVSILERQAVSRVRELVPIRYERMSESPFAFYRGAAAIMASDLAATPRSKISVQVCGDAHLANFGVFGSPERKLLFDINDFDETLPGPWEWDVKRLAASFEVAGRDLGFSKADRRDVVTATVREYRQHLRLVSKWRALDVWYDHMDVDSLLTWVGSEVKANRLGRKEAAEAKMDVERAKSRHNIRAFRKLTTVIDGEIRIAGDPPLIVPIEDLVAPTRRADEEEMQEILRGYRKSLPRDHHPIDEYRLVHIARKVVGVGSVGTRCWIILLLGRNQKDPLILQAKEAQASVLEPFVGESRHVNHGTRVVEGQRLMQAASDIFLGWQRVTDHDGVVRDYYMRQLHDWKGAADIGSFRVAGARLYARMCGVTLARAHARSGDRIAIASYLGRSDRFDQAIVTFAERYADQNERDYESFLAATRAGRLALP
jgi:uncharacterized protein (DUF2252 family)